MEGERLKVWPEVSTVFTLVQEILSFGGGRKMRYVVALCDADDSTATKNRGLSACR
jgi:hypothetical protein